MAILVSGALYFNDSMTAVSSPQHNLDLQSKSMYRTTVSLTITGMVAVEGGRLLAIDAGSGTATFSAESASSTAANRIATASAFSTAGWPAGFMWYDPVSLRWRRVAK